MQTWWIDEREEWASTSLIAPYRGAPEKRRGSAVAWTVATMQFKVFFMYG
jgi:hypothetical protein